jgi:iron complex transport system ATP-binding protein
MTEPSRIEPWLSLHDLAFHHGPKPVIRGLSLDFHPGRHYILAGPNGAGKSTLLDLLASLKKPAKGEIILLGRPLDRYNHLELAKNLALAPQNFRLNFAFSVREVVAMGRRPYLGRWGRLGPDDRLVVERSLAALNLENLAGKPVIALSGGERQRVVVARALAQATPILLLDEPTAGLDVAQGLTLMELARRLAVAGALVITVTHDLNLAGPLGHEFIFLKKGRVTAAGPTAETFTSETLAEVYEAEARVVQDDFAGGPAASFRCPGFKGEEL